MTPIALALALPAAAQSEPRPLGAGADPTPPPAEVAPAEPAPPPAPDPTVVLETTPSEGELRAEIAAQAAALAEAKAQLAEQQRALEQIQQDVAATKLKLIPPDTVRMTFEGHYRVRGYVFNHLFQSQGQGDAYEDARYLQHRLIFRPKFDYKNLAKFWFELRGLDDVVWGDNANLSSTALFAGEPSATDPEGQETLPVTLGRVWAEATVPVGLVRVGRMPSDWGMGLLVSSGDKLDQDFGEMHYPSSNDRVLFATRPVAIYDKVTGRADRGIPLILAVAVDRLVEDPLYQYYGYECEPGVPEADPDYDPRCDSDGDGLTDLDHGYQDDEVTSASRGPDWWVDQQDDVWEMVYVLAYRGEGVDYLGGHGDLTLGAYVVNRIQDETDSNVWIADGYLKAFVHRIWLESEVVVIRGETRALPLPDATQEDPLAKTARIAGYGAKAGYVAPGWKAIVETGYASGDEDVVDGDFTGRALHPDHNVGLLLYEEVLANVTAAVRTTGARGLWSNGGVYSSRYVNPVLHLMPLDNWEILGGFLTAWPVRPDGAVIRCNSDDPAGCDTPPALQATADSLGWEIDAAVKHRWHEHLLFSLETGYAKVTDRLPLESAGLNPKGNFFTLQSRFAFEF